jgi:hypothetical protein
MPLSSTPSSDHHGSITGTAVRSLLGILVLAVALVEVAASGDQTGPKSILYLESEPDRSDLTTLPASQQPVDQASRCFSMMKEIEALKGKPQRRATAMARYEAECQRDSRQP